MHWGMYFGNRQLGVELRNAEISVTKSSKTKCVSEELTGLDAPSPSITPSCRALYPFFNNLPMA